MAFLSIGFASYATDGIRDSTKVSPIEKKLRHGLGPADSVNYHRTNHNHFIGHTFRSNYYKNVPLQEQTPDDNISYRPYIQTTSGSIIYYEEIYQMGRRY